MPGKARGRSKIATAIGGPFGLDVRISVLAAATAPGSDCSSSASRALMASSRDCRRACSAVARPMRIVAAGDMPPPCTELEVPCVQARTPFDSVQRSAPVDCTVDESLSSAPGR